MLIGFFNSYISIICIKGQVERGLVPRTGFLYYYLNLARVAAGMPFKVRSNASQRLVKGAFKVVVYVNYSSVFVFSLLFTNSCYYKCVQCALLLLLLIVPSIYYKQVEERRLELIYRAQLFKRYYVATLKANAE